MAQAMMMKCSLQGELEVDVEIKAPAEKYYHMLTGRPQDLPKATPDNIQRCDLLEGEYGKPNVAKERIKAVEPKRNLMVLRIIEGDLMKEFKSFLITIQATPKQRVPGSLVKCQMKV